MSHVAKSCQIGLWPRSAFPPVATELRTSLEVRFVPMCDIEDAGR
jgi:hypothetical protein